MTASGSSASMSTGIWSLLMGPKRGKDDYRTCTRENSPQTEAVGRFPGLGMTRTWNAATDFRLFDLEKKIKKVSPKPNYAQ